MKFLPLILELKGFFTLTYTVMQFSTSIALLEVNANVRPHFLPLVTAG